MPQLEQADLQKVTEQAIKISKELLTPNVRIHKDEYKFRRNRYFENTSQRDTPAFGTINNINIFIRFSDEEEFAFPRSHFDWPFNDIDGPSLNHYYLEVSNENLEVVTAHYPACDMDTNLSYQDEHPRSYYQLYNAQANPNGYFECPSWYFYDKPTGNFHEISFIQNKASVAALKDILP